MSYGVPVVISSPEWCGFAQYLTQGRDAVVLSDPRDAEGLCDAIARVGTDAALRDLLCRHGREVAAARSWEHVAARYEALYAQVLAERH
jgi:UDP-glucose:(heptosyl)LPS alpha-1,3-glucosyltransferase